MQPKIIHNFRRRAYWYGYKEVKIQCVGSQSGDKLYQVSAIDPLGGLVCVCYPIQDFDLLLRNGRRIHKSEFLRGCEND